jgi:hypothetical protein
MMRTEERSRKQEYDPSIRSQRSQNSLNGRPSFQEPRPGSSASNRPLPPPPFDDHSVAHGSSTHATEGEQEEEEMEPLPERYSSEGDPDVVWRGSIVERDPKHHSGSGVSATSGSLTTHRESMLPAAPSPTREYQDDAEEVAEAPEPPTKRPLPSPIGIPSSYPIPPTPPKEAQASKYDSIMAERGESPSATTHPGMASQMSDRVSKLVQMYTKRSDIPIASSRTASLPHGAHKPLPVQQ